MNSTELAIVRHKYLAHPLAGRAHAVLGQLAYEERAASDKSPAMRIIRGVATSITPDRYGDVVMARGVQYKLPLPALWQHSGREPIGNVVEASVGDTEIPVVMELPLPNTESKIVNDRLSEAWASVTAGLVRGLSIGFRPLGDYWDTYNQETNGFIFNSWEWLELSLVTIPANADATITAVKSHDTAFQQLLARLPPAAAVVKLDADFRRRAGLQNVVFK